MRDGKTFREVSKVREVSQVSQTLKTTSLTALLHLIPLVHLILLIPFSFDTFGFFLVQLKYEDRKFDSRGSSGNG